MILLLDVGNSQTVVACWDPVRGEFVHTWRFTTRLDLTAGEWLSLLTAEAQEDGLDSGDISDVAMASVVPSITNEFLTLFDSWLRIEPLVVSADLDLGIEVAIERPREVGADRLCNAVAAFQCVLGDAIVVDLGTATKVEAITANGVYLGGAIAPGISVSLESLVAGTAQLYSVPIEFPNSAIGANTVQAMQSGLVLGHLSMIEGMVQRFRDQIGAPAPVLLTGGYGHIFWQRSDVFDRHEPELTLRGLLHIWNLNQ